MAGQSAFHYSLHSRAALFNLGWCSDFIRNARLLELFDGKEFITLGEIATRMHALHAKSGGSLDFEAKLAGELIRWSQGVELVICLDQAETQFKLIDRRLNFMVVGSAKKGTVIRLYGKDAHPDGERLAARELKRRARAQKKLHDARFAAVDGLIKRITSVDPGTPLSAELQQYSVEGVETVAGCRELLVDAALNDGSGVHVTNQLELLLARVQHSARQQRQAEPEPIPAEDLEAFEALDL